MGGMTEYLLDPIERGELRVERYDAGGSNVFCCVCKRSVSVDNVECISPDPYAPPVCHDCLNAEEARRERDS